LKFNFIKTNLAKEIKSLAEEMKNYLPEKNIKLVLNTGRLPFIRSDPDRIMQVLRNLINNAKKFSPEGSKVFVAAELKNKMLQFSVNDQGIGVSPDNQKRIFDPFFQAEGTMQRKYQGTGLGLAMLQ